MIKKITSFISSMKFGMLLLSLIVLCSLAGSLIPQGYEASYYRAEYNEFSTILLFLQLDRVFSSWYFIVLLLFLCINLVFCSILRLKNTIKKVKKGLNVASSAVCHPIDKESINRVENFLKSQRFKLYKHDESTIYYKNIIGYYGSFFVHLSLLLILSFGSFSMYYTTIEDVDIMVGESVTLSDGTAIKVNSFQIENEYGETDYKSILEIRDKHGNTSAPMAVSVNHPISFDGHKYYQQTYGLAGYITVTNKGIESPLYLKEQAFITLDDQNGVMYFEVFPSYDRMEDGSLSIQKDWSKGYTNPIYQIAIIENDNITEGMALPGTSYQVGEMLCTFNNPVFYPGIRVKTSPDIIMLLLYISFMLMIFGLWLCFFHIPTYVKIDHKGYAIVSPKSTERIKSNINAMIKTCEREENNQC